MDSNRTYLSPLSSIEYSWQSPAISPWRPSGDTHYTPLIGCLLEEFFPSGLPTQADDVLSFLRKQPLIHCSFPTNSDSFPNNIRFIIFSSHQNGSLRFYHTLLARWLIPGEILSTSLFFATDIHLPSFAHSTSAAPPIFTLLELTFVVMSKEDLLIAQETLPQIILQLRLGAGSFYQASKILESKGITDDQKSSLIQDYLAILIHRGKYRLDETVYPEMQRFLFHTTPEFRDKRSYRHLTRLIITIPHLVKNAGLRISNEQRDYLCGCKLLPTQLIDGTLILGIAVGVYRISSELLFDYKQFIENLTLIEEIQQVLIDSHFAIDHPNSVAFHYIECIPRSRQPIDKKRLSIKIAALAEQYVQRRLQPLFMPRNEEEVMRYVVALTQQLHYVNDPIQSALLFDGQAANQLIFSAIFVRILKPSTLALQEVLTSLSLPYIIDSIKRIGLLRKRYPKEASIMQIHLNANEYSRNDGSIDLYRARDRVMQELEKVFGVIRDFNGGMIAKEREILQHLIDTVGNKLALSNIPSTQEEHLQNFFYALRPAKIRTLLPIDVIADTFLLLYEAAGEISLASPGENHSIQSMRDFSGYQANLFCSTQKDTFENVKNSINNQSPSAAQVYLKIGRAYCFITLLAENATATDY